MKFILFLLLQFNRIDTLQIVKQELTTKYPAYTQQINQVKPPTIQYKERMWFNWKKLSYIQGDCDPFRNPQIRIAKNKNEAITLYRLKHELKHFVIFAAGLPPQENKILDKNAK